MSRRSGDGSVGYRRPPVYTRFKPGQSGNPRGRPKRKQDARTMLDKLLAEPVVIVESGKRRKLSKLEVIYRQLVNRAAAADFKAIAQLAKLMSHFGADSRAAPAAQPFGGEDDEQLLQDIIRRYATEQPLSEDDHEPE